MARLVVEFDGLLKMPMGAGKIAELKAIAAGNAMPDHGLGTIRPGRGFAQEKLGNFAHWCRFAAGQMPAPKTVIGREPFRGVFLPARECAGARIALRERLEKGLRLNEFGELLGWREARDRRR